MPPASWAWGGAPEGYLYALLAAASHSCIDALRKVGSRTLKAQEMVGFICLVDTLCLLAVCWAVGDLHNLAALVETPRLALIVVLSAAIKQVASVMYQRAVAVSPLALTVPYLAFTPVLLIFTSYILNDELPSQQGFGGVLLVALGGYLLQVGNASPGAKLSRRPSALWRIGSASRVPSLPRISENGEVEAPGALPLIDDRRLGEPDQLRGGEKQHTREGGCGAEQLLKQFVAPLMALRSEEGSLLMLGVAALWSFTSSFDKLGLAMSPSFLVFATGQRVVMMVPTILYLLVTQPACFRLLLPNFPVVLAASVSEMVTVISYLKSLETLLVSYAIAAKRSGIVISVVVGGVVFKENVLGRLPYVMLMFIGMLTIIFSS